MTRVERILVSPAEALLARGATPGTPRNTPSWMAIARSSQARTPMNASGCSESSPVARSAERHNVAEAGNRYFFGDCGPTL